MLEYDSPGLAWTQQHSTYIIRQSSQLGQPNAAKPFIIVNIKKYNRTTIERRQQLGPTHTSNLNNQPTRVVVIIINYNKSQIISTNILDRKRYIPDIEQIKYRSIQRMNPTILAATGVST